MTEACLLALLGGLLGLVVARWTLHLHGSLFPSDAATLVQLQLQLPVLLFAAALALGTGVLFGLFPALHSTRPDLVSALKGTSGQPAGARGAARFRTSLATLQVALSMALLVAAGLFTRSLVNVSRVELGVSVESVLTFGVSPELNGYSFERCAQLFEQLEDELAALPGVTGVTDSLVALLAGNNWGNDVSVEGFKAGPDTDSTSRYNEIGPSYFRTLAVPLIAGREFTRSDSAAAPKVAIVNEEFARKFNLGRDAVGKRLGDRDGKLDTEIVGLVQNAKYSDVKRPVPPVFFRPYRQDKSLGSISFYVRTALAPERLLPEIPKLVARIDPTLPVENLRTMPQQVRDNVFLDRFISLLSVSFAGLATLLAAIGLYGVLAYTVAQRTREIGLRMALGAAPGAVLGMVLKQVGIMTLVGGVAGATLAVWLGRLAQSLLYELKGWDPLVLTASAVTLAVVALGAGFVPARRASRIDPMKALRYEEATFPPNNGSSASVVGASLRRRRSPMTPSNGSEVPLAIEGATKRFGSVTALDGVSFELGRGELLGLLGPNGAGKTTMIKAAAGRLQLDSGAIRLFGRALARGDKRPEIGVVPQELGIYDRLTARENLEVFGRLYGVPRRGLEERVRWALEWSDLKERSRERVSRFSGGMKRRLNIAVSLLHQPSLVLLDEPTVGVDPQSRERIYEMLADLQQQGVSMVLTTHHLEEAERRCQRIVIIDHGRTVADGTVAELVGRTIGATRTLRLTLSRPLPDLALIPGDVAITTDRLAVTAQVGEVSRDLPLLLQHVTAAGGEVADIDLSGASLQDVFIRLTGRELRE
jgi:ABC-type multidrug transport system ATPase subunit/ABC-type antimicrobial peptide transport system permease subunit